MLAPSSAKMSNKASPQHSIIAFPAVPGGVGNATPLAPDTASTRLGELTSPGQCREVDGSPVSGAREAVRLRRAGQAG